MIKLFVNDTKLFNYIHTFSDCEDLQADLVTLQDWNKLCLLTFNTTSCTVLRLGINAPTINHIMTTEHGSVIVLEESLSERDLGVLLTGS